YIRYEKMDWDGKEITVVEEILEETATLAERDKENHMLREDHSFINYFEMRQKQFELIQQMLPLVTHIPKRDDVSESIADFLEELSRAVHPGNTAVIYLDQLSQLQEAFKAETLPKSVDHFESRSNLMQLLNVLEEYLLLKKEFKKSDLYQN